MFNKVLLAIDGSDHSAKAEPVAADIAKKSDGEVLVFHAQEWMVARGGAYGLEDSAEAHKVVGSWRACCSAAWLTR